MPEPLSHILIVPSKGVRLLCGASPKKTGRDTVVSTDSPGAATCPMCKECLEKLTAPLRKQLARIAEGADVSLEKYYEWANGGDSGVSSRTLVHTTTGARVLDSFGQNHPHDPADFGRCYRVLKLFPELRGRLGKVAETSVVWERLVEAWDELEALYEEEEPTGMAPKLYARMKELIDG